MGHTPELDALRPLHHLQGRLGGLLADPEPGLPTWRAALSKTCLEIGCFAGVGNVEAFTDLLTACEAVGERFPFTNLPGNRVQCGWCEREWDEDGDDRHRRDCLVTRLHAAITKAKKEG